MIDFLRFSSVLVPHHECGAYVTFLILGCRLKIKRIIEKDVI